MLSTSTGSENSGDGPWWTDDDGKNRNSKAAIYAVWVECDMACFPGSILSSCRGCVRLPRGVEQVIGRITCMRSFRTIRRTPPS